LQVGAKPINWPPLEQNPLFAKTNPPQDCRPNPAMFKCTGRQQLVIYSVPVQFVAKCSLQVAKKLFG